MGTEKLRTLVDELAAVVAEMETMAEDAPEGEEAAPMTEEQEASLRSLEEKADKLRTRIEFLQRVQAKNLELRSVIERGAPAKKLDTTPEGETVESRNKVFAVPKDHGNLKGFKCAERAYRGGMALKASLLGDHEARRWCDDHGVSYRAQAQGINSLGGALTNAEMSTEIVRLIEEYGVVPQYFKKRVMSGETLLVPRRTGGLSARPIGENTAPDTSNVTWDNIEILSKIWGIDNRTPVSLIEDSPIDFADAVAVECAQAFAEAFDNAGLIGTGTAATYHGTVGVATAIDDGTHTASVVTAASGNNTFDTLDLQDFTNAMAKLPRYAMKGAKWFISSAGYGSSMLRLMVNASGNNAADVAGGAGLQFLGFPVVICHPLQSALTGTGSTIACLFGDMSLAATYGVRREVRIATDASRFIEYDQLLTFASARVAMVAHDLGTTSVAGPVVALKFNS